PLVGRGRELTRLSDALHNAVERRSCQLFTVLGAAGVGKSRLVDQFPAGLGDRARSFRGRCLSYGRGITYWPLVEVWPQLPPTRDGDTTAAEVIERLVQGDPPAPSAPEIAWAARKGFELAAQERPLIVAVDDLHWAEDTL